MQKTKLLSNLYRSSFVYFFHADEEHKVSELNAPEMPDNFICILLTSQILLQDNSLQR
jgi:hypothetical protein